MRSDDQASAPAGQKLNDISNYVKDGGGYDVALSTWAIAHGVPIPPSIIKRFRVGISRLIDGSFDYAATTMRRAVDKAEFNARQQQHVVSELANKGTVSLSDLEPELATEVARSFLNEHGLKLANRNRVVEAAFEELRANPPTTDSTPDGEVDLDWLNRFAETASLKSDPDMQKLMGKILAGEIRKPGSFSQLSVNILATLSQEVARKFEALCSVSFQVKGGRFISTDMFPSFLAKGIPEIAFTYQDLLTLRSYQLLAVDSGSGWELDTGTSVRCKNDHVEYQITAQTPDPHNIAMNTRRLNIALFSPMGAELGELISIPSPEWFAKKANETFTSANWSIEKTR